MTISPLPHEASGAAAASRSALDLGFGKAHSARVYDYFLRGKNHYPPDRETARYLARVLPQIYTNARVNRAFMHRATAVLARDFGIRQWLDIGTGFPHSPDLHEVAQSVVPDARVVYLDNDPIVLSHLRALMAGGPRGRLAFLQADATDPAGILNAPELKDTLNLSQPVALTMTGLLPLVTEDRVAYGLVRCLLNGLPRGSALVLTHCTGDFAPEAWQKATAVCAEAGIDFRVRSREEVERFFTGLTFLDPGLVVGDRWRRPPDGDVGRERAVSDADVSLWAGIGLKTCRMLPRHPRLSAESGSQTVPGRGGPAGSPLPEGPQFGASSSPSTRDRDV